MLFTLYNPAYTMISTSSYTQIEHNTSVARNGGIMIKGQTRNERQPVHLILVVDTSGSMELENKLPSVKKSIQLMLTLLSPDDRLSLVTFADSSKTFLNRATPTPEEREAILYRVNNLEADGSTNMSAGLLEARGLVEQTGRKQGLILLTDGHANIGVHTEQGLIDILKRIQTESPGVSLTTVAYGVDHNAEMLTNLAKVGGGAYNVVTNLEDVATVFGDILGGLISVSAQKVEVQFPPGTEVKTSYRSETDAAGMVIVYVGDIYADAEITILFKSSPSQGPIRIKGTDMTTLDPIDTIITVRGLQEGSVGPLSLVMAEYRQEVVDILQKVRSSLNPSKSDLDSLIKRIEDDDRIRDHPLKPILIEDLQQALKLCERGHRLTQHETVEMAQHTAYLGFSRGLRTTTLPQRTSNRIRRQVAVGSLPPSTPPQQEEPTVAFAHAVTSPFANRMQTQLASVMRTMSSQVPDENSSP